MGIASKFTTLLKYLFNQDYRDYRYVRKLPVFDSEYYVFLLKKSSAQLDATQGDGAEDLLWHYFQQSWEERQTSNVSDQTWKQLKDPHPLFDTWFYLSRYGHLVGRQNPFAHYLKSGWKKGLLPSPLFDPDYYSQKSNWVPSSGDPLTHFANHGLKQGISPSASFDIDWYLDKTPDSDIARGNAIKHYKQFGIMEGKSPHRLFQPTSYLGQLKEPNDAEDDPFLHYSTAGDKLGIKPNKYFDPAYYRARYMEPDFPMNAFDHYLKCGLTSQAEINGAIEHLSRKPTISIVVPVFNPEHRFLKACIRSVFYQTYPYWELCLVDDFSSDEKTRDLIRDWAAADPRIVYTFNSENHGISKASQIAVEMSIGEFLGFLDNDDKLSGNCLYRVVKAISETNREVIYSDEDLISEVGTRHAAFYKPDFNRALLYSHNYITHFVAVSRERFDQVGGMGSENDGAQDYDLMLRLAEVVDTMHHVPRVLYHWRAVQTSTSVAHDQKPYAHEAGRKALQQSLTRSGLDIEVEDTNLNYHYRLKGKIRKEPSVSVIFFTDRGEQGGTWLQGKTDYENLTIITFPEHERMGENSLDRQISERINKALAIQQVIDSSDTEFIALLGHGAAGLSRSWLTELVSKFQLDGDIGITCGRVSYDGSDGFSYVVPEIENTSVLYYAAFVASASRHANGMHNLQWINGCDWQICLICRQTLNELSGFDHEHFQFHLPMLDVCYRATGIGKKILYTPDAIVTLKGSILIKSHDDTAGLREKELFQQKYFGQLAEFDRWYNSNHVEESGIDKQRFFKWLCGSGL